MQRLRSSFLALLVHLAFLFNIERMDVVEQNIIDIDTVLYGLTVVAVVLILSIKRLKSFSIPVALSFWTGVYFAVKLGFNRRPLVGGVYTYLSITELALFIIAVLLTQNLAFNLQDFEQAVENITFANIKKIKQLQNAMDEIQMELYRSRRYQSPLTLIVIEPDQKSVKANLNRSIQDAQRAMMMRYVSVGLARDLSANVRRTDMLFEYGNDKFALLCVETGLEGAGIVMNRLRTRARKLGFEVNLGVASFPDHALTFEALLNQAEKNLQIEASPMVGILPSRL